MTSNSTPFNTCDSFNPDKPYRLVYGKAWLDIDRTEARSIELAANTIYDSKNPKWVALGDATYQWSCGRDGEGKTFHLQLESQVSWIEYLLNGRCFAGKC